MPYVLLTLIILEQELLNAYNRNVEINVHTDAVATYAEDARKNYVDAAYLLMEQQGIQLVKKINR